MVDRERKLVLAIIEEFLPVLCETYLVEDDIRQEAFLALFIATKIKKCDVSNFVRSHIKSVIYKTTTIDKPSFLYQAPTTKQYGSHEFYRKTIVIKALIERLPLHERVILKLSYGMFDGRCYDCAEISSLYSISVKHIRSIIRSALKRIKNSAGIDAIRMKLT